jgi:hypothetical protein
LRKTRPELQPWSSGIPVSRSRLISRVVADRSQALERASANLRAEFVRLAGLAQTLLSPRAPEDPSPLLDHR